MQIECFGEASLNREDRARYDRLMFKEIDEKNPAITPIEELILQ